MASRKDAFRQKKDQQQKVEVAKARENFEFHVENAVEHIVSASKEFGVLAASDRKKAEIVVLKSIAKAKGRFEKIVADFNAKLKEAEKS